MSPEATGQADRALVGLVNPGQVDKLVPGRVGKAGVTCEAASTSVSVTSGSDDEAGPAQRHGAPGGSSKARPGRSRSRRGTAGRVEHGSGVVPGGEAVSGIGVVG